MTYYLIQLNTIWLQKKYAIFRPWITSRPAPAGTSGRPRSRSRPEGIRSSSGPTTAPPKNDPIYIKESEWVSACVRACVRECVRECVSAWVRECVSAWVRECVSAWVRECVSACVRAWARACVSAWVRACVREWGSEWVEASGGGGGGGGWNPPAGSKRKTRTPHSDVGKNQCLHGCLNIFPTPHVGLSHWGWHLCSLNPSSRVMEAQPVKPNARTSSMGFWFQASNKIRQNPREKRHLAVSGTHSNHSMTFIWNYI